MRVPRSFLPVRPSVSSLTPAASDSTRPSGWRPHPSPPSGDHPRVRAVLTQTPRGLGVGSGVLQALKKLKWRRWCAGLRRSGSRGARRHEDPHPPGSPGLCRRPRELGKAAGRSGMAGWGPASAATRGKERELLKWGLPPPWCHGIFLSQMHGHLGSRHDDRLQRGGWRFPQ